MNSCNSQPTFVAKQQKSASAKGARSTKSENSLETSSASTASLPKNILINDNSVRTQAGETAPIPLKDQDDKSEPTISPNEPTPSPKDSMEDYRWVGQQAIGASCCPNYAIEPLAIELFCHADGSWNGNAAAPTQSFQNAEMNSSINVASTSPLLATKTGTYYCGNVGYPATITFSSNPIF